MSVINDMLRDLEARKAPERDGLSKANIAELIEPNSGGVLTRGRVTILVILLVAAAIGVGAYLLITPKNESVSDTISSSDLMEVKPLASKQPAAKSEILASKEPSAATEPSAQSRSSVEAERVVEKDRATLQASSLDETDENKPAGKLDSSAGTVSENPVPEITVETQAATKKQAVLADGSKTEAPTASTTPVEPKPLVLESKPRLAPIKPEAETVQVAPPAPKAASVESNAKMITLSPDAMDQQSARKAVDLFQNGQDQSAYRGLYEFIEGHQVDVESRIILVTYLLRDQRLSEAGDFLLGLPIEDNVEARQLKARWLMANARPNEALDTLFSALPAVTENPEYHALLASYSQQFGEPDKTIEVYSRLIRFDSQRSEWWAGLAIALDRAEQFNDALIAYRQAMQLPGLSAEVQAFVEQRIRQLAG